MRSGLLVDFLAGQPGREQASARPHKRAVIT